MTKANVFILPPNDRLAAAVCRGGGANAATVAEANAIVFNGDHPTELVRDLHAGIRWVQIGWAGIDGFAEWLDDGRTWTSARGIYGAPIAEHVIAMMLAAARNLHRYARALAWGEPGVRSLAGSRACVVGAGGIGAGVARLLLGLQVEVTVLSRSETVVPGAATRHVNDLPSVLPNVDWLVLAMPLTPETHHLIGAPELSLMRRDAWIINVARGAVIDTTALVAALEAQEIGGAALDVTDPEPLPDNHPLWTLPDVLITPHTACPLETGEDALAKHVEENVRRWMAAEPLVAQVSP